MVAILGLEFVLWLPLYRQHALEPEVVDVFEPGPPSRPLPQCPAESNVTDHYQYNWLWPHMIVDEWTGEAGRYVDTAGESLFGTNETVEAAAIAAGLRCSVAPQLHQLDGMEFSRMIFPSENVLRAALCVDVESASAAACPTVREIFELLHQASRPRFAWMQPSDRMGIDASRAIYMECKFEEQGNPERNVVWYNTIVFMDVMLGLLLLHVLAAKRDMASPPFSCCNVQGILLVSV